MNDTIYVSLQGSMIDIPSVIQKIQTDSHGAIDLFIGMVRNNHQGKIVTGITYDAHPHITKKVFTKICKEAQDLWPETKYAVSHFKGYLGVGGISIVIAVSSPHRAESFDACRYVIEEIKKRAPVWKQEHYLDQESAWLPGQSLNKAADVPQTCLESQYG